MELIFREFKVVFTVSFFVSNPFSKHFLEERFILKTSVLKNPFISDLLKPYRIGYDQADLYSYTEKIKYLEFFKMSFNQLKYCSLFYN